MGARAVNQRSRLENADLIFIRRRYFPCIGTTVQTANSDIIVYSPWNYLDSFKVTGQNNYVTACCVRLCEIRIVQEH